MWMLEKRMTKGFTHNLCLYTWARFKLLSLQTFADICVVSSAKTMFQLVSQGGYPGPKKAPHFREKNFRSSGTLESGLQCSSETLVIGRTPPPPSIIIPVIARCGTCFFLLLFSILVVVIFFPPVHFKKEKETVVMESFTICQSEKFLQFLHQVKPRQASLLSC